MNTTKTTVAHHQHVIAGACHAADPLDELREVILDTRPGPHRRQRGSRIPAQIGAVAEGEVDFGNWSFMTPSFIVFERGSRTARMRAAPTLRRRPATVVAMAVG